MDSPMFQLDQVQLNQLHAFMDGHNKICKFYDDGTKPNSPAGAIGGRLTFSFTPTGLGNVTVVKCACGEAVNLTDYASW